MFSQDVTDSQPEAELYSNQVRFARLNMNLKKGKKRNHE